MMRQRENRDELSFVRITFCLERRGYLLLRSSGWPVTRDNLQGVNTYEFGDTAFISQRA